MKAVVLAVKLAPALIAPSPLAQAPSALSSLAAPAAGTAPSAPAASAPAAPALVLPAAPMSPDEARAALSGWSFLEATATDAEPADAPASRARALLRRAGRWLLPPALKTEFDLAAVGDQHHGMSLATLGAIAAGDGVLRKHTYFSDTGGMSWSYSAGAARRERSLGVVLQFPRASVADRLVVGHYQPTVANDRHPVVLQLARYSMSVEPIRLSEQSELSKSGILGWLERMAAARPGDESWPRLLETFRRAFGR